MKKKIFGILLCISMAVILVGGCSSTNTSSAGKSEEKTVINIGTSSVSKDLAESGKKALEDMGYKVEIKVFDDYVLPNDALAEGTLDANFYQHEPYMNNYNKSHGTNIIMLEPKLYNYYTGLYSVKADSIEDLPNGGAVGIAQDAANISVQLKQLQEAGIITLSDKPAAGDFYTVADIVKNPHNYDFVQSDHVKYKNMDDYTIVIGTSNTMAEAGVDPTKHLLKKFVDQDLTQGICVLAQNKDTKWAKDIMTAYTSKEAIANVPASSGFEYAGK
ncbi:MetQ/NlpA family ABC transporter substrate-binding protein [Desulfosporosinus orientis]|nr:MetQ/NlpA family ABC transporter substrate-binding protein [Desulfosporosinus orientis]